MQNRSSQLDLLRTIAISLVFIDHFNWLGSDHWFKGVSDFGWIGVDLFFVLSGFLIAGQLVRHRQFSFKEFYIRRGLRIWPNFIVILLIYFTIPAFHEREALPPLWKFLTFTQNFGIDISTGGTFSHAWSLCVEEQFYFALPLLLLFMGHFGNLKRSIGFFAIVVLGGIVLRYSLWNHFISLYFADGHPMKGIGLPFYQEIYYPTYCRLDGLAVGVALAALVRLRPVLWLKIARQANWLLVSGLAMVACALLLCREPKAWGAVTFGFPILDLGFGLLVAAAVAPQGVFSQIELPGVKSFATLAFAFYLTHKPILHLMRPFVLEMGVSEDSYLFLILLLLVCVTAACALYLIVERPFLQLRDHILSNFKTAPHIIPFEPPTPKGEKNLAVQI
jgi:peptidoglycan/LPS O-acetylase OafA/YrhL